MGPGFWRRSRASSCSNKVLAHLRGIAYNLDMQNTPADLFSSLAAAVRETSDARIDETVTYLGGWSSLMSSPEVYRVFEAETARRAGIRLNRGEFGSFEAEWYESRPLAQCDDCGHDVHDDETYQRCNFFAGIGAYAPCNCQNIPALI